MAFLSGIFRARMSLVRSTFQRAVLSAIALFCFSAFQVRAVDSLRWQGDHVGAEISKWDLGTLLEKLVEVTGWEIYVDPDATRTVSVKFKDWSQGEAFKMLFGDLNFALLHAKAHGAPRLFFFRTSMQETTQCI